RRVAAAGGGPPGSLLGPHPSTLDPMCGRSQRARVPVARTLVPSGARARTTQYGEGMTYPGKPVRPTTTGTMNQVVVVGGANLDIKARTTAALTARTSNPGVVSMSPGGVGRNIAENLARLGTSTRLVCALGRDDSGTRLASDTLDAGVVLDALYPPETR